jgi:hypothetical protein
MTLKQCPLNHPTGAIAVLAAATIGRGHER